MKAYVATTGSIFVLIVGAHAWRVVEEGSRLLREPSFVLTSLLAAGITVWSALVLRGLLRTVR